MKIFYEIVWLFQRLIRRNIGIARINKLSVSINQVNSNITVTNSLSGQQYFNNYKQRLNSNRKIVKLSAPILNPKSGVLWIKKLILEESTVWPVSKLLKWEPTPFLSEKVKNTSINLPDNGYYHFVIEDLPRFFEVFRNQQFNQVIIGSKSNYILETLDFLKVENFVSKKYPVHCDKLLFSEKNIGGIFTKLDHTELQSFSSEIKPSSSNQILFIDRKNKQKGYLERGLKYADLIANKFKNFDITRVFLEDLSLIEQISLFKSSKLVIGFHGAGLANMVWIDRAVKIFEITEDRITSHFEHIASVCEHEYTMLKASELAQYNAAQISKLLNY
jgi:hypothetical protein